MSGTHLHPTAGYIMNVGVQNSRGTITSDEINYLRELAKEVAEIANLPIQKKCENDWIAHNDLKPIKPLVICYPEDGWGDLIPLESLKIKDRFWANYEWYLRHLIYRHENINDDFVIKAEVICFIRNIMHYSDWGLGQDNLKISTTTTTYDWGERPLSSYNDLHKIKLPELEVFYKETEDDYTALNEVFGGILEVNKYLMSSVYGGGTYTCNQPGVAANLRGIEQILYDMYDYPDELHELLRLITKGNIDFLLDIEKNGLIRSNNSNYYIDAGGNGYTNDLPSVKYGAKLKDCWGYGVAQEYSEVSPEMHADFGIKYQKQVLSLFGLNAYGCCEPYSNKFEILDDIPNLRRVSVSPFCDFKKAADSLKQNLIYSFKPNPALLISDTPMEEIRAYLSNILKISKDCRVEIFLKDIIQLKSPFLQKRFKDVANVIKEEIDKVF
jgi:hypothetical protein